MLKWAKQSQRRVSECSDLSLETCSTLSSDSSESGITLPIRYHERRTSRPKSLALASTDILDLDHENGAYISRRSQRSTSSPLYSSCSRANRHSMIVTSRDTQEHKIHTSSIINNNNNVLKISTMPPQRSDGSDVLRISTNDCEKSKSRNSFWRNLRAKAQGKKSEKKLAKANSMSNIPDMDKFTNSEPADQSPEQSEITPTNNVSINTALATTCPSPVVMRKQQKPLADSVSPSRTRANVMRRRSFKLIKKQNENKKPKPFSKVSEPPTTDTDYYPTTGSPDSGISSLRHASISTTDSDFEGRTSPGSPITPIDLESNNENLTHLRQQLFTDAVLQFLNERLEKKGYATIIDRSSSTSSNQSDDGAPDIFCYDTDTVARRPSHRINRKPTVEATH